MSTALVAFVGENENGILRHLSQELMQLLEPFGFHGHVVNLHDPDWMAGFATLVKDGIAMAWGHAGIGARLQVDGECLWDLVKVPFVSVLADPPCWQPSNHAGRSPFVANAYLYSEWLQVQRRFIRSAQLSVRVQGGVVPNPLAAAAPWRDRTRRMVLVKTGDDAEARRRTWQALPRRLRAIIEDAVSMAVPAGTGDVTEIVVAAADANGLVLDGRTDILFGLTVEVDRFVRDARSTALVRALLHLPVDIYGRGWDHVAGEATAARFRPAFDARALPALYADTQFLLNTSPNFGSGVHERIGCGLEAGCCVVSDENTYTREHLGGLRTFIGIDPYDPALPDRLAALFHDKVDHTDAAEPARALVDRLFNGRRYMHSLLELAQELRAGAQFSAFRH